MSESTGARFCADCGCELPAAAAFCPSCGQRIEHIETVGADSGTTAVEPATADVQLGVDSGAGPAFVAAGHAESEQGQPDGQARDRVPAEPAARTPLRKLSRGAKMLVGGAAVLALAVGGVFGGTWWSGKADRAYLAALEAAYLRSDFGSDAEAIAHAKNVCTDLSGGAKAEGQRVDLVGVQAYCADFAEGFRVLSTATVYGSFTLIDTSLYYNSIEDDGDGCHGTGGYSDIRSGTPVTVKDSKGTLLASTTLGAGEANSYAKCEFNFSVTLTEGESAYVVSVARRGDTHFTWEQLTDGFGVTLGD